MKKLIATGVLALSAIGSSTAAFGGPMGRGITVHVPFEFTASGSKLPAGDYYVAQDEIQSVVFLTNLQNRTSVAVLPESNTLSNSNVEPGANFVKTETGYVLKTVHVEGGRGFLLRSH